MNIGIVGSEAAKFTPVTEALAKQHIRALLGPKDTVISGACHLGGIDVWAAEIGREMGLTVIEHPPKTHRWEGGYKQRNLKIVEDSDKVVCITLRELPEHYTGMRFSHCYHCHANDHVKSGGCWTMLKAKQSGKEGQLIII